MLFDSATASHLKPWLVRTLEPICDAEPGALADYILALLKHNVPESDMRKELAAQLDEFLEKECLPFIDTLFTVLRTKSYLPYATSSESSYPVTESLDNGIPIPLDGLLSPTLSNSPSRNRKRSIDNDDRDGRPSVKAPRLSADGQFSRYGDGRSGGTDARSTGGWGGQMEIHSANGYKDGVPHGMGMGNAGGLNGSAHLNGRRPQVYQPPEQKRGICRDYHNNGYCARGAFCKFSHGDDAVVPGSLFPMNGPPIPNAGMPFMPMFSGGGVPFGMGGGLTAAYDPHEARMDMRPMGGGTGNGVGRPQARAPLLPRIQQEDGSQVVHSVHASGELPVIQDLTPNIAPDKARQSQSPLPQSRPAVTPQYVQPQTQTQMDYPDAYGPINGEGSFPAQSMLPINGQMAGEISNLMQMSPQMDNHGLSFRSGKRVSGNGRGRGTFGNEAHSFRPERRTDKTLVVEKIPEDKLTLEHVNAWFKRFGTVTNVAIDSANAKALVSFANHDEALAAWKSEDAVFNNRFVKLFWHRPMEGHGKVGARLLAASAPLVANMATKETNTPISVAPPAARAAPAPLVSSKSSATSRKPMTASTSATSLAAKQQLLEQQIAEHQSLMVSLETASAEEKKDIMARLRKLGEEMKSTTSTTPAPSATPPVTNLVNKHRGVEDPARKERERLDKELELHHATAAAEGEQESTQDLKAKLERLKAEAASLGLTEGTAAPPYGGAHRPFRGRGRGSRGYHRGSMRGGPPRASMKLDNRPKKLLVKAVTDESVQALRDWYETTGQMESLDTLENGDIVVSFRTRAAAEQGLAKGSHVPIVGPIQVTWYTNGSQSGIRPMSSPISKPSASSNTLATMSVRQGTHSPEPERPRSPLIQEEEIVASGWGGEGDGEDGMGML